jgi:uncharacterized protein YjbJ (UPF0337 family)
MNWTQIEGQWHQFTGKAKTMWGKLTDDDLKTVAGKRDQLIGKIQQHYGVAKEDAEKQVHEWAAKVTAATEKHLPKPASPPMPAPVKPAAKHT